MRVEHAHSNERHYCSEVCAKSDCPARAEPLVVADVKEELRRDDHYAHTIYAADMEVKKIVLLEGQDIPGEAHKDSAQTFLVTEGRVRVVIGCGLESHEIGEDGFCVVPRDTQHRIVNVWGGTTRILSTYARRQHPLGLVYKQRADAL